METLWEINKMRNKSSSNQGADFTRIAGDLFQIGVKNLKDTMEVLKSANLIFGTTIKKNQQCKCTYCCEDPWIDCLPCGPLTSTTDINLEGRFGESRLVSVLLENNTKVDCKFEVTLTNFMDGCGQRIDPSNLMIINPRDGVLPPCSCKQIDLLVNLLPPFKPSQVYYGEIRLNTHCDAKIITFGIWVKPDTLVDYLALCNPCYPQKGKLVEVATCDSGCGCGGNSQPRILYACPSGRKTDIPSNS